MPAERARADHAEAVAALAAIPRSSASANPGLDYFYDKAPRDVQQAGFRAHIRAARLTGLPLVHPCPRRRRRHRGDPARGDARPAAPFAFLLHCFSPRGAPGRGALAIGGYRQLLRHPDLPKSPEIAGDRRAMCRPTGCWSRPTRPTSRRCRSAASATSRAMSRIPREVLAERPRPDSGGDRRRLTTANFRRLFRKAA